MAPTGIVAFGPFELDCRSGELRKHGLRVRLAEQPRIVLELLLARPGEPITRDEIRQRLWPANTFVDFDAGLSSAVRKLREALGDSAEQPRFIETLPRRGYRFIAPVTMPPATADISSRALAAASLDSTPSRRVAWIAWAVAIPVLAALFVQSTVRPAVNPEANDAFLKGVAARGLETVPGFRAAVGYFEDATRKQRDFAMAYARMGEAELQLVYAGQFAPRDVVPRADAAVQRALALDDRIALAHRTRGSILQDYYWHWDEGDREFRRAFELDPTSLEARSRQASTLLRAGRVEEAIAEAQQMRALDPLARSTALTLAAVLRSAGRYDHALSEYLALLERDPQVARGHFQLGVTYACLERWPDAIDALRHAVQLTPANTRFLAYLGFALAKAGRTGEARAILADLKARAEAQYVSSFGIALIHDALGEREPALAALARAYEEHALEFTQWRQYPGFEIVQRDPRYQFVRGRTTGLP